MAARSETPLELPATELGSISSTSLMERLPDAALVGYERSSQVLGPAGSQDRLDLSVKRSDNRRRSSSVVEQGTHKPLVTGPNPVSATSDSISDPGQRPGRSVFGLGMCWISLSGTAVSRLHSSRTTGPRRESPSWKDVARPATTVPSSSRSNLAERAKRPSGVYCGGRPATHRPPDPEAPLHL